jgi:hypothetical protein
MRYGMAAHAPACKSTNGKKEAKRKPGRHGHLGASLLIILLYSQSANRITTATAKEK